MASCRRIGANRVTVAGRGPRLLAMAHNVPTFGGGQVMVAASIVGALENSGPRGLIPCA